jgi:hypothetical protein
VDLPDRTRQPAHAAERTASRLALDCDRTAPRRARDHLYDILKQRPAPELSDDDLFDVLLCTSELVNAALLGGGNTMTLDVEVAANLVRLTLCDDTPLAVPGLESARAQEHCLRVVATIADRWETELTKTARITRAEFDLPRLERD